MVYACDCSIQALDSSKHNVLRASSYVNPLHSRFHPFYCDFSTHAFPHWLACNYCKQTSLKCQHRFPGTCNKSLFIYLRNFYNANFQLFQLLSCQMFAAIHKEIQMPFSRMVNVALAELMLLPWYVLFYVHCQLDYVYATTIMFKISFLNQTLFV